MKICEKCGSQVGTKAESCPKCGDAQKKITGCFGIIGAGILILFILGLILSIMGDSSKKTTPTSGSKHPTASANDNRREIYSEGERVYVGYASYVVLRSWWSSRLGDHQFMDDDPDAMFLFIEVSVRNDDKKAIRIPPFTLIDDNGDEHETISRGREVEGSISSLDNINPGVEKQGKIIFDVPQSHKYKLVVSGDYWTGEKALIKITPE